MTTVCKAVYAMQIFSASFSRLLLINLFAMALKDGAFYLVFIVIWVHLLIALLVHVKIETRNDKKPRFSIDFFLEVIQTSTFTNLTETEEPGTTEIMKDLFMELVILMEYLAFWIVIFLSLNFNPILIIIMALMWTCYLGAICLKMAFYFKLHPSSALFKEKLKGKQFSLLLSYFYTHMF